MTDRPIIFSAPLVRALLDGRKTQTRRLAWRCRETPTPDDGEGILRIPTSWQRVQPGDRLWVREAWGFERACAPPYCCEEDLPNVKRPSGGWTKPYYQATSKDSAWGMYGEPKWRSPIHMPRSASRLTLTVSDVRRQRLQEISEDDARDEGCWSETAILETALLESVPELAVHPSMVFRRLWDKLHGPGAWDANPEVVALTFAVAQRNIDDA